MFLNVFWIGLLYLSLGVFYKKKNPDVLYIFLFVFGILAVVLSVFAVMDYTETTGFCADICHPMDEYGESYVDAEEDTILGTHREEEVNCADCHNKPGVVGIVKSKYAGVMEVVKFVTGSYPDPIHHPEVGEEFCAKSGCHDDVDWMVPMVGANLTVEQPTTDDGWADHNDIEDQDICNDCHAAHQDGLKFKPRGCTVCHDVEEEDLEAHEDFIVDADNFLKIVENVTSVKTCSDCHETMDRVPYKATTPNEFCSSCHTNETAAYDTHFTIEQLEFYGGCADCHDDHKDTDEPHQTLEEVDCEVCHDPDGEGNSIHNPTAISYEAAHSSLTNEFCSDCHEGEFSAYEGNVTSEQAAFYGGCVDCHADHDEDDIKEVHDVLEDVECQKCHVNYDDEITSHNPSEISFATETANVNNEFCSGCHSEEFEAYSGNLTAGQGAIYGENCVGCHTDHDEADTLEVHSTPEGLNCENCHTSYLDGIATHDPSQISYLSVSSKLDGEFCNNCHEDEFDAYYANEVENADRIKRYGDCSNCHSDHDVKTRPHSSEAQYDNCITCHTSYTDEIKTHTLNDVDYGSQDIENEFCQSCHEEIYDGFSKGSIQDRTCVYCHSSHKVNIVNVTDNCSTCHSNFKYDHNP